LHSHLGNQEKQLYLLFCVEACQYFTDISVSDDKSVGMLPTIKVSTVICIGSFCRTLYVINVSAFTLVHFSTASLFSVYHPHVGTAAFIHVILLVRSLLKVLSLL
jgi:hypothetical protein